MSLLDFICNFAKYEFIEVIPGCVGGDSLFTCSRVDTCKENYRL